MTGSSDPYILKGLSNIFGFGLVPSLSDTRRIYDLACHISSSRGTYQAVEIAAFVVVIEQGS